MKILLGSDFHCSKELCNEVISKVETEHYDLFLYAGDFCNWAGYNCAQYGGCNPKGTEEVEQLFSFFDKIDSFTTWFAIPGNHEPAKQILYNSYLDKYWHSKYYLHPQLSVVKDSWDTYPPIKILAIPYTPYCGWNWTLTETINNYLLEEYRKEKVDIILTHAPPKGHLDNNIYTKWDTTLLELMELLEPKYYICGHVHECGGMTKEVGATTVINCATTVMEIEL